MYAIIDIETTGGSPKYEKITEVAIFIHDGQKITDEFVTLINPEKTIPYHITSLTGITNEMVSDAPKFYEVAKKIVEITDSCVFVAHNAAFDYGFLKEEFQQLGYPYQRELICTVKMSRKLIPGFKSYSLGNLCRDLNIQIENRHRAAGDALATVKVFEKLLSVQNGKEILTERTNGVPKNLHPQLDPATFKNLPEEAGVYYFMNEKQDIIYIGKSNNIKQRVFTHFNGNKGRRAGQMRDETAAIGFEITGSELAALLLESDEIKKHKPLYNRAQRRSLFRHGIISYTDQKGYIHFSVVKTNENQDYLFSFVSKIEAVNFLENQCTANNLCPKLCGLYENEGACFLYQIHQCLGACKGIEPSESYNARALEVCKLGKFDQQNFLILDTGRKQDETLVVKVEKGTYRGFGYIQTDLCSNTELMHDCINNFSDNRDVHMIIQRYMKTKKGIHILPFHNNDL
jgi:DNA polymerase III subunit epsilon